MGDRNQAFCELIEIFKEGNTYDRLIAIDDAYNLFIVLFKEIIEKIEPPNEEERTKEEFISEVNSEISRILPALDELNDLFIQIWKDESEDYEFRLFVIDCVGWLGNRKTFQHFLNLYSDKYLQELTRLRVELTLITYNPDFATQLYMSMGEEKAYFLEKLRSDKSWNDDLRNILIFYGNKIKVEQRDTQQALKFYQKALAVSPKSAAPWYHVGLVYLIQKNHKLALHSLQKALEIDPSHSEVWMRLGHAYEGLKQIPQAIKHFEKAVQLDSDRVINQLSLGMIYFRTQNIDGARKCLEMAIQIDPSDQFSKDGIRFFKETTGL